MKQISGITKPKQTKKDKELKWGLSVVAITTIPAGVTMLLSAETNFQLIKSAAIVVLGIVCAWIYQHIEKVQ